MGFFDRFRPSSGGGQHEVFDELRSMALRLRPADLHIDVTDATPVYGILMEMGRRDGTASFVCLKDGTVSLYTSPGGGVIGAGDHEQVRSACQELLSLTNAYADEFLAAAELTQTFPLPDHGSVFFDFLSIRGVFLARCSEKKLQAQQDPFAALYSNCHVVLAEAREATENHQAGE